MTELPEESFVPEDDRAAAADPRPEPGAVPEDAGTEGGSRSESRSREETLADVDHEGPAPDANRVLQRGAGHRERVADDE